MPGSAFRHLINVLFPAIAIMFLGTSSWGQDVEDLIQRRDNNMLLLHEVTRDIETYTALAAQRRRDAVLELRDWAFGEALEITEKEVESLLRTVINTRTEGQILLRPQMIKRLDPVIISRVIHDGYTVGQTIGKIDLALREAGIYDDQVEASLARLSRVNRQISSLELEIADRYRLQALAQNTLMSQGDREQPATPPALGPTPGRSWRDFISVTRFDGGIAITLLQCEIAERMNIDPNLFGCPRWNREAFSSGRCWCTGTPIVSDSDLDALFGIEQGEQQDVRPEDPPEDPPAILPERAEEFASFCQKNPDALMCIPGSDASRFADLCSGPSAPPECSTPLTIGRLGAYCEGPNPLPDCLSVNEAPGRLGGYCSGPNPPADCLRP